MIFVDASIVGDEFTSINQEFISVSIIKSNPYIRIILPNNSTVFLRLTILSYIHSNVFYIISLNFGYILVLNSSF